MRGGVGLHETKKYVQVLKRDQMKKNCRWNRGKVHHVNNCGGK
jgi:hypothetical protein